MSSCQSVALNADVRDDEIMEFVLPNSVQTSDAVPGPSAEVIIRRVCINPDEGDDGDEADNQTEKPAKPKKKRFCRFFRKANGKEPEVNSPTEKQANSRKKKIGAFFQRVWRAVKRPFIRSVETVPDVSSFEPTTGSVHTKYTVVKTNVLGSGNFGDVYEATCKSDGKQVAIKYTCRQPDDYYLVIPGYPKPLITEVALLLKMREAPISPFVIQMYEWYEDSLGFKMVLEYPQPCETLADLISYRLKLNEATARHLMRQAVQAVQHCLEHGVFHNDIHPENFLVNVSTMRLKLIDFGCGHLLRDDGYDCSNYIGHYTYCPPEACTQFRYYAMPTNVWALGVVLYEMVNGTLPFIYLKSRKPTEKLEFVNPRLSKNVRDLIKKCLNKDPTKRPTLKKILKHPWLKKKVNR